MAYFFFVFSKIAKQKQGRRRWGWGRGGHSGPEYLLMKCLHSVKLLCQITSISHIVQFFLICRFYCFCPGPHSCFKYARHNHVRYPMMGGSISWNVASLKTLVHDMINLFDQDRSLTTELMFSHFLWDCWKTNEIIYFDASFVIPSVVYESNLLSIYSSKSSILVKLKKQLMKISSKKVYTQNEMAILEKKKKK